MVPKGRDHKENCVAPKFTLKTCRVDNLFGLILMLKTRQGKILYYQYRWVDTNVLIPTCDGLLVDTSIEDEARKDHRGGAICCPITPTAGQGLGSTRSLLYYCYKIYRILIIELKI